MSQLPRPRLRSIERFPLTREDGEECLVLRDPLGVADSVAIDRVYEPLLDLMDGTRSVAQIRQSLRFSRNWDLPLEDLGLFVDDLSEAGFLDGDEFRERWEDILGDFLENPIRKLRHRGNLYPEDKQQLKHQLQTCLPAPDLRTQAGSRVVGLLCPHQPFVHAHDLFEQALVGLPPADELDLIVILATDHHPGLTPYVLTDKQYETHCGSLPTAIDIVHSIEEKLPWVTREEIRHRDTPAIELTALLLAEIYGSACPKVLPVLCGQSALTTAEGKQQADSFIEMLEQMCCRRRVLFWACAELSHVGPAYGGSALTPQSHQRVEDDDLSRLYALQSGRIAHFVRQCMDSEDRPSGTAALSTLARMIPPESKARNLKYRTAPAEGNLEGLLGLAGLQFVV